MADKQSKTVTLVHPDGRKVHSSSPLEISRLHYGLGFAFEKVQSWAQAIESLGQDAVYTEPVSSVEPAVDHPKTDTAKK